MASKIALAAFRRPSSREKSSSSWAGSAESSSFFLRLTSFISLLTMTKSFFCILARRAGTFLAWTFFCRNRGECGRVASSAATCRSSVLRVPCSRASFPLGNKETDARVLGSIDGGTAAWSISPQGLKQERLNFSVKERIAEEKSGVSSKTSAIGLSFNSASGLLFLRPTTKPVIQRFPRGMRTLEPTWILFACSGGTE